MPILPSAKKALRVSQRKKEINQRVKAQVKSAIKKLEQEKTEANLQEVYSAVDKAVKKNIYHRNKGARLKRKAAKLVNEK